METVSEKSYRRTAEYIDARLYEDYCRAVREGDGEAYDRLQGPMGEMVWNLLGSYLQAYRINVRQHGRDWEDLQGELWLKMWKRLPLRCQDYPSVYQLVKWISLTVKGTISNLKRKERGSPDLLSLTPEEEGTSAPEPAAPFVEQAIEQWEARERCADSMRALLNVRRTPAAVFSYCFCRLLYPYFQNAKLRQRTDCLLPEETSLSRRLEQEYRALALFLMREDVFENLDLLLSNICCQNLRESDFTRIDQALAHCSGSRPDGEKTFGEAGGNVQNIDTWNKRVRQSLAEKGDHSHEI